MSSAEDLYEKMRKAIQKGDHDLMWEISEEANYEVNREDRKGLGRVALHTAAQREDQKAVRILLSLPGVDPSKRTKEGLTPVLLAAENGKAEALEALLDDQRVDADECDDKDQTLEEIIATSRFITNELSRNKTRSVLDRFRTRQKQHSEGGKMAIIIGNSIYKNGMSHLEGAKRDLDEVSAIMEKVQYKVHKVENSEDILADIETVMEGVPDSSITHLHLHYTGNEKHLNFSPKEYV